jgi:hypothetical protein
VLASFLFFPFLFQPGLQPKDGAAHSQGGSLLP